MSGSRENEVGGSPCDRHDWTVRVTGNQRWHDRAINDPQPRNAANAKHWIDDRHRILPHTASTSVMAARCPKPTARVEDLFRRVAATAWKRLVAQILPERRLRKEPTCVADHVDGEPPIILGGEKVSAYGRRSGWVSGANQDITLAIRPK